MKIAKNEIVLIKDELQRFYFSKFCSSDGTLLMTDSRKIFVVDARYIAAARNFFAKSEFEVFLGSDIKQAFNSISSSHIRYLCVDYTKTTLSELDYLKSFNLELKDASDRISKEKAVKKAKEIELIKKSVLIAEKSFNEILPLIKKGVTEKEVAFELECRFVKNGATKPSFSTIVAFGENSAVPHHETGNTRLTENSAVLIDFGCVYKGYCSDITRTLFYGEPSDEFKIAYKAVKAANELAKKNITSNMLANKADYIARSELEKLGYGKLFTHSLGHGIGVNIHEAPYLSPKSKEVLKNGMVFSIEPGVYLDGKFGIRIEDTVLLKGDKVESLVSLDRELKILK